MRLDKFTIKAQEALQAAQSLAEQQSHQAIEPEHLLAALIEQREGIVGPLLAKLGARPDTIQQTLGAELAKLPAVRGGSGQYLGERTRQGLERAQAEALRLKDDYVSTEHLLIALAQDRDGAAGRVLAQNGVTAEAVYKALAELRGTQRVTDPSPEEKYQALPRYPRDRPALASRRKHDPVRGRDDGGRVPETRREGSGAGATLPAGDGARALRGGHDRDSPGPQGQVRGAPQGEDQGHGARRRDRALAPLHHRPLPARQGDRPRGRGGRAHPDADRLDAPGHRRDRAPYHAAPDRARLGRPRRRPGLARAAREDRRRAGRAPGAQRRPQGALAGGEGRDHPDR